MTAVVWRIGTDTPDYGADDLSGEGARRTGGRWNSPGIPMIYTGSSIALACLETIVHLVAGDLPLNRYLVSVEIPDDVWKTATVLQPKHHVGWDAVPAGITSLQAGSQWAKARISALLLAPSVIVPEENNILINPAHPAAARLRVKKLRRWTYDARLR